MVSLPLTAEVKSVAVQMKVYWDWMGVTECQRLSFSVLSIQRHLLDS